MRCYANRKIAPCGMEIRERQGHGCSRTPSFNRTIVEWKCQGESSTLSGLPILRSNRTIVEWKYTQRKWVQTQRPRPNRTIVEWK